MLFSLGLPQKQDGVEREREARLTLIRFSSRGGLGGIRSRMKEVRQRLNAINTLLSMRGKKTESCAAT